MFGRPMSPKGRKRSLRKNLPWSFGSESLIDQDGPQEREMDRFSNPTWTTHCRRKLMSIDPFRFSSLTIRRESAQSTRHFEPWTSFFFLVRMNMDGSIDQCSVQDHDHDHDHDRGA
ncbi:hypothetical protein ZHAS_00009084 [Anopheles sinensis]|uniref:Uncharacterized protein n=1 Tax=Anopheles sinensis TaxID=74873 RepID=A0A084VU46_ANOSI|nr:hypothetical protein ZHAS_00009084 [Anopheles sinensis]